MKAGDRVKVDFIGESATIYSGKRFTGYGVLDRVEDGRVFGRLDDGTPFMCLCADVEVVGVSEFKSCPVCQEQSDQCLPCGSYVVDGERIYYEKLKDFGATKDHEVRFINRIQKHRTTAFFHNGKLYIPSRQGRSVPLAIGLQWDAWQEQQAKIDELHKISVALNTETIRQREQVAYYLSKNAELQKRVDDLELTIKGAVTFVDLQIEATEQGREAAIGTQAKNWWSSKLLMLRPVRRVLEQALKGGDE